MGPACKILFRRASQALLIVDAKYTAAMVQLLAPYVKDSNGGPVVLVGSNNDPIVAELGRTFPCQQFATVVDPVVLMGKTAFLQTDCSNNSGVGEAAEPAALICFLDAFRNSTKTQKMQVLSRARDLLARRVLHLEPDSATSASWSLANSLSLGYSQIETVHLQQQVLQVYEFNIHNYKNTPEWLNANHWSNPQQWDRYRW